MNGWHLRQLTFGTHEGVYHSHSYYDIPVMSSAGRGVLCFQTRFAERHPTPEDAVEIGIAATDKPGDWRSLGRSTAWSWQQGPMAQFVPSTDSAVWNDREGDRFVARMADIVTGARMTLPRPVYALDPQGRFALSLNMARLNTLRPGYGYATTETPALPRIAQDDGVWRLPLDESGGRLVLPLDRAVDFLCSRMSLRARLHHWRAGYHYWFNHAKLSPDGTRFTVKLRWRKPGGGWNGTMGVSLTCGSDGSDLRYLAPATSHVIWLDNERLYYFAEDCGHVVMARDNAPQGQIIDRIGRGVISSNVHLRHLPGAYVYDTPYCETIDLYLLPVESVEPARIARFSGHTPARGPFRCDLHPVPDAGGNRIVVASMQDGGRQVYLLERDP